MKFFNKTALSFVFMLATAVSVQAGNQGIHYYYGAGLAVMSSDEQSIELDATAGGELILGIEEDGWALEYSGFRTMDAGTSISSTTDYSASMTHVSLGYRTIEQDGIYYKIKAGSMSADFDFSDATVTAETEGNFIGVGMGMRMSKDSRVELEYSLYSSDDIDTTHLITLHYLFGGAPYEAAGTF